MFDSIVVAYDGSASAERALEAGSKLAAGKQARLGIVYVIDIDRRLSNLLVNATQT